MKYMYALMDINFNWFMICLWKIFLLQAITKRPSACLDTLVQEYCYIINFTHDFTQFHTGI